MSNAMEDPMVSSQSQTLSTSSFFTPLLISIMGIGVTAVAILVYHILLVRYCLRGHAARMAALRTFTGEETVDTGVDQKTLETIPIITYKKADSRLLTDQCECTVCLGDVENGDRVRLLPNCKHLFHVKCIDEWFVGHTSCPVCRAPVVAPDDETRGCPVCRSVGAMANDHIASVGCDDQSGVAWIEVNDGPRMMSLRHCHSLVLPGEIKGRFRGMELKRSLSMGQSGCAIVDINYVNSVGKDHCMCYWSFKDESVKRLQRVSSKVKQSISRMCVGHGQRSGVLPY